MIFISLFIVQSNFCLLLAVDEIPADEDGSSDGSDEDADSVIPSWDSDDTVTFGEGDVQSPASDATVCLYSTDTDSALEDN